MVGKLWSISIPVGLGGMAVAILVNVAAPAVAQSTNEAQVQQAVRQIFGRFDSNGDGNITDAEFTQAGKRDFAALDTNGDSVVSKEEFLDPKPRGAEKLGGTELARAKQIWSQQFAHLDTDKNGKLSAAEHESAEQQSFDHMDGNKDGEITLAEMTTAITQKQ
jgi:Ca2+-binding EF-hand superfamily protein